MAVRHKCSEREKWVTQTNKTMLEHELQWQIMQANQFHVRTRIINKQHWQIMLAHQFHLRTVLIYCLPSSIHRLRTSWFDDCVVWFTRTWFSFQHVFAPAIIVSSMIHRLLFIVHRLLFVDYLFIHRLLIMFVCLCFLFVGCYFQCRGGGAS